MLQQLFRSPMALLCMAIIFITALLGIFAPWVAPNDPYANDILNKFAGRWRSISPDKAGRRGCMGVFPEIVC